MSDLLFSSYSAPARPPIPREVERHFEEARRHHQEAIHAKQHGLEAQPGYLLTKAAEADESVWACVVKGDDRSQQYKEAMKEKNDFMRKWRKYYTNRRLPMPEEPDLSDLGDRGFYHKLELMDYDFPISEE